jgi:hypothetical protein
VANEEDEEIDIAEDLHRFDMAREYYRIRKLGPSEQAPLQGVFSHSRRPATDGRRISKRDGKWQARTSAGWIEVPHPPAKDDGTRLLASFAGRSLSWSPEVEWAGVARRMLRPLRHTEPSGMLADGSVPIKTLATLLREPIAHLLEAALFSYDADKKTHRFEIMVSEVKEGPQEESPQLWVRATRKHSVEVMS